MTGGKTSSNTTSGASFTAGRPGTSARSTPAITRRIAGGIFNRAAMTATAAITTRRSTKIWIGKTFLTSEGSLGLGDIGYFDTITQDWKFLHVPEMSDWSASALLVEPTTIWVGLIQMGDDGNVNGGLLRYEPTTRKAQRIPLPGQIDKIIRVGKHLYCATSNGFAIVDQDHVQRFEFSPQLDGEYTITPVT